MKTAVHVALVVVDYAAMPLIRWALEARTSQNLKAHNPDRPVLSPSNHTDIVRMAPKLVSAHLVLTEIYDKTREYRLRRLTQVD